MDKQIANIINSLKKGTVFEISSTDKNFINLNKSASVFKEQGKEFFENNNYKNYNCELILQTNNLGYPSYTSKENHHVYIKK